MAKRPFPSICADGSSADRLCAYDGAESALVEAPAATWARHDLIVLSTRKLGLRWSGRFSGQATQLTAESIEATQKWRADVTRRNPRVIILANINLGDAPIGFLPLSSALWRRAPNGRVETTMTDSGIRGSLDSENLAFSALLQQRVSALMASRTVDGVVLRAWGPDSPSRLALVKAVRRGLGPAGVIVLETGVDPPSLSAPYTDGLLVVDDGKGRPVWSKFSGICAWARKHLRKPGFTVLETRASLDRTRLYEMRMATTLALVFGDGFVAFGDATGHDWYDFWAPNLGRPLGAAFRKDGAYRREFENGTAVFNPPTNSAVVLDFPSIRRSAAKSISTRRLSVQAGDGDIALSKPPAH